MALGPKGKIGSEFAGFDFGLIDFNQPLLQSGINHAPGGGVLTVFKAKPLAESGVGHSVSIGPKSRECIFSHFKWIDQIDVATAFGSDAGSAIFG